MMAIVVIVAAFAAAVKRGKNVKGKAVPITGRRWR
jgi:hypothetical protein